ncbi:MAG: hypothetical protein ACTTJ3_06390 [Treponema sp.]
MIKKGYLFSLVVFCSLFFWTACKGSPESDEVKLLTFKEQKMAFDTLMDTGFVPPVIRLPDSYVNDKIESKAKKLSYEFYYYALSAEEGFDEVDEKKLFSPTYIIQTATIAEEDAGDASKTKIKYDKLKGANGGDLFIGTKFVLGLRVKNQADKLVYRAMMQYIVHTPKASATGTTNEISLPGNQTGCAVRPTVAPTDCTLVDTDDYVSYDGTKTIYKLKDGASNKRVSLKFGEFGETNKVLVK